jgi:hypothetical protein
MRGGDLDAGLKDVTARPAKILFAVEALEKKQHPTDTGIFPPQGSDDTHPFE